MMRRIDRRVASNEEENEQRKNTQTAAHQAPIEPTVGKIKTHVVVCGMQAPALTDFYDYHHVYQYDTVAKFCDRTLMLWQYYTLVQYGIDAF